MLPLVLAGRADGGQPLKGRLVQRGQGAGLELFGRRAAERFVAGPFYESKSMFVHRDGKRYTISYWCAICSIRTYTPGKCMCSQQETELSLQEDTQR